ncbi:MAG TPA: hypothetical protein VFO39_02355 [Candidatus Sulfotelmatobacter sp.]|nr:hypothetical protein [Candidatus Sulfotelmatobacter sp.]
MKKKLLVVALATLASLLLTTNLFATSYCTSGAKLKFVGVGSSAQINALAFAAANLELAAHGSYGLISVKSSGTNPPFLFDSRSNKTDNGITMFVVYDPTATTGACDTYVYFQTDSGVGVREFFAYERSTINGKIFPSIGAAWAVVPSGVVTGSNAINGLRDGCFSGSLNGTACSGGPDENGIPSTIQTALNTTPVQMATTNSTSVDCGNLATVATNKFWCYFNAAGTDVRPEDALFATTRALTTYNGIVPPATHGGTLTGEGYGAGSAGCAGGTANIGCGITDSFNQGSTFNVVKFALSGTDPISGGTLPSFSTLSVGAAPLVVIVGNEDSANLGHTFTDSFGKTNYTYNNINRETLSQVFSGYAACVGDINNQAAGGAVVPLQVVQREPLSGTYNAFEFTAVRVELGGPPASTVTPNSSANNGQEQFNDPAVFPNGTSCSYVGGGTSGFPNANCFNPLFLSFDGANIKVGSQCQGASGGAAPGLPVRLRGVGSGQLVKAVVGSFNSPSTPPFTTSGSASVFNPIGYAFWNFGNLKPLCSAVSGASCTGTFKGHYLTVDGIDPLFTTPGGEFDSPANPSGAFNPPVCDFTAACPVLPFTHLQDGTYPLWSVLRTVTFAPVASKVATPTGVLDMIANEEITSDNGTVTDYVPFLTSITGSNGNYTGNLGLFVFRSHFMQVGGPVKPANGHKGCNGTFTGIKLQGGKVGAATCLVDFGSDEGGSVLTVQQDVDFLADFGVEEFGLRQ